MPTYGRHAPGEPMERLVPCSCGSAHPKGLRFFVTCIREPALVAWLLGPYRTHAEALANVDRGRELAEKADPFTAFDAFGTAGTREAIAGRFGR